MARGLPAPVRDTISFSRRRDREAEGAPLLREYVPKAHRGFESLRLRHAPLGVAALTLLNALFSASRALI